MKQINTFSAKLYNINHINVFSTGVSISPTKKICYDYFDYPVADRGGDKSYVHTAIHPLLCTHIVYGLATLVPERGRIAWTKASQYARSLDDM